MTDDQPTPQGDATNFLTGAQSESKTEETKPDIAPDGGASSPEPKPDESQAGADASSDQAASEAGKTLSNRKKSFQSRIGELTYKVRDAERREAAALAELARLKGTVKPDPTKFDDMAELTAATVDHSLNQRDAKRIEENLTNDRAGRAEAVAEAFQLRVADFMESNPDAAKDFEAVAYHAPIGPQTAEILANLDEGPAVAYYLGKNPAEARRIDILPEREKAAALGRIAGRLTTPPPRKISSAPTPLKPVAGNSNDSMPDVSKMSQADFEKNWGKIAKG